MVLSAGQREVLRRFDDPMMAELFKDICFPQHLRSDIFIRGTRKFTPEARDEALREVSLGLTVPISQWKYEYQTAAGRAAMPKQVYEPIVERLAQGPATVRELQALALQDKTDNPAALIGLTVGTSQAIILPNPGVPADARCLALNRELLLRHKDTNLGSLVPVALPSCGSGIHVPALIGVVMREIAADPYQKDPQQLARLVAGASAPDQLQKLAAEISAFFEVDAPVKRNLGLPV
jgi:hypothetical protein